MRKALILTALLLFLAGGLYAKEAKVKPPGDEEIQQVLSKVHWIHHASFRIEADNKIIYIDPYQLKAVQPADYILLTHGHPDHLSKDDIKRIAGKNTLIICSPECVYLLKGYNLKVVKPGDKFEIGNIKCEAVPAYNISKPFHKKASNKVGYIIDIDNVRIYDAGDTDFIDEMKKMKNIAVAMVPVGGLFTMGPEEAAKAVKAIKPKIAIPMHYGYRIGAKKNGGIFVKLVKPPVKAMILTEEEPK